MKYGVYGGLDAWRKLYNKYVPLAYDQQHILIRELMSVKQVSEIEVDQFVHDVERICDLYIKAGSEDDLNSNRWARACVMQNLPDKVVTNLALELKQADSVEATQKFGKHYVARP